MKAPESNTSITEVLVPKYDLSQGDGFFTQEITGNYAYALQIVSTNLAGGNVVITLYRANEAGDGTISSFQITTKTVTINADGIYILEDSYFSPKYMGILIDPGAGVTGEIELVLTLSKSL